MIHVELIDEYDINALLDATLPNRNTDAIDHIFEWIKVNGYWKMGSHDDSNEIQHGWTAFPSEPTYNEAPESLVFEAMNDVYLCIMEAAKHCDHSFKHSRVKFQVDGKERSRSSDGITERPSGYMYLEKNRSSPEMIPDHAHIFHLQEYKKDFGSSNLFEVSSLLAPLQLAHSLHDSEPQEFTFASRKEATGRSML